MNMDEGKFEFKPSLAGTLNPTRIEHTFQTMIASAGQFQNALVPKVSKLGLLVPIFE